MCVCMYVHMYCYVNMKTNSTRMRKRKKQKGGKKERKIYFKDSLHKPNTTYNISYDHELL